jgi:hypothetical protein
MCSELVELVERVELEPAVGRHDPANKRAEKPMVRSCGAGRSRAPKPEGHSTV